MEHIRTALQKAREQQGRPWVEEVLPPPLHAHQIEGDALWSRLPGRRADPVLAGRKRVVTVGRSDPSHTAFDILRTKVLQALRQNKWTSIAITSPTPGCGKTIVGLNLAFSLEHQKDCRTVLVDLDLRRPQVAKTLNMSGPRPLESFLRGEKRIERAFERYGDNLAIAANDRPVRFAAELLQSPETVGILKDMARRLRPDVVIFDLPPMLANDDVMAFVPNVDCAILVVAAEATTMNEADLCERELSQKTNVLGIVLNKCRYMPDKYGY
ncbi:Mrp family chromosome partitioning ATPase [Mesorhizobium sp. J18]|uniref:CpsD/CapB family tyrosine-protein kinase n=1 Tax=Mesorhizobium sp. J18 TaxID=935263 RepID=UPI00119A0330|nr:CpsD/CapB family tyrosine-protein kinase [Mesorhizobium sp. J18]TWG96736.1 Mrp family chromosome partitioning ATPase [Mesorhizobium sp. J18]